MMWDLNYFKYYFLKLARVPFDEQTLEDDFQKFTDFLLSADRDFFLYRDFQSRNVMIRDESPWFIDYQGGRRGALQYDIASLLFDAKADIPQQVRDHLLEQYLEAVQEYIPIDRSTFMQHYYGYVFVRIMQALGAYGFRGFYERKTHFLKSVPYAIRNLEWLLRTAELPVELPALTDAWQRLVRSSMLRQLGNADLKMTVRIQSFSFKRGIPVDEKGHGGGHVFDCRLLPNPGREAKYADLTGEDPEVIAYLEKEPEVDTFLEHVQEIVSASVANYQKRNFTHLMVSFGCTGGQHRSVYCASRLARYLSENFDVDVETRHREQEMAADMNAMILAAGRGTRLGDLTKNRPKALIEAGGTPLITHVLNRLRKAGYTRVIINLHHCGEQIREYVEGNDGFGLDVAFSDESELLDTGGGLKKAAWFFQDGGPFLLHNTDVLSTIDLAELRRAHAESGALATIAVRSRDTSRYFLFDEQVRLVGWENVATGEKKWCRGPIAAANRLSFMGIHMISPEMLGCIREEGVFSIVDVYLRLAGEGELICGYRADESRWMDLGRPEQLRRADAMLREGEFT